MVRLPGIAMLGYVAAHSETLAMAVIMSKGLSFYKMKVLSLKLNQVSVSWQSYCQRSRRTASTQQPFGHLARLAVTHQNTPKLLLFPMFCQGNLFLENKRFLIVIFRLLESYTSPESSEDLQTKSKAALKKILQKCVYLPALEPLLHDAPSNILQHVVAQYSKVLPNDPAARRLFVTSGGLKKVQEIKTEPETALCEYIREINTCFPEEIVRYYSPGYSEQLLQRVECYKPSDGCQTISVPDNLCKEGINTSPSQN